MRKVFTDAWIKTTPTPAHGRVEHTDLRCAGLSLRITARGARSWCFRFRDPVTGKDARFAIGDYPDISLSDARSRADDLRRLVAKGGNPTEQKRKARRDAPGRTFSILADRYLEEYARRHKRSAHRDEANLRLHVLPRWRNRDYSSITRADVIELLERMVSDGKPVQANRIQALISTVFAFGINADLVQFNPCARLTKRVDESERAGTRVLSDEEIRIFWSNVIHKPISRRVGLALRIALLTGARAGEIAGMCRTELNNVSDPARAEWIIPAERSKNGRVHLIPLLPLALKSVNEALQLTKPDEPCVFPSPVVKNTSITGHALAVAMARFAKSLQGTGAAVKSWKSAAPTPHDLRRTFATRLSALGVLKEDRDACMNHRRSDVGSKHYDLYERRAEKLSALTRWNDALAAVLQNTGSVVPLRLGGRP